MSDLPDRSTTHRERSTSRPVDERIRQAISRLERAVERKPAFGHSTTVSVTMSTEGLRCSGREDDHMVVTDLGPAFGGDGTAPTPSALLRAALGSCLAMGYRLRAAHHGIPIDGIRVEIETDSAIEGLLDPDSDHPPGFTEIRYRVQIDSPAPPQVIEQLVNEADRLSPLLDAVTRPNRVVRRPSAVATIGGGC